MYQNQAFRYVLVLVTYIAMQLSGYVGLPLLERIAPNLDAPTLVGLWSLISFVLALAVVLFILKDEMFDRRSRAAAELWLKHSYRERKSEDHVYLRRPANGGAIVLWVVLGTVMAYGGQIIAALIEINVFGIDTSSENTAVIMDVSRSFPLFMLLPMVLAPILEEIVFRQIIFRSIYRYTGFFIAGVLSALIFAVVHQDFTHMLIYLSMGFTFAFLYIHTKRIIVPILVHMAMNSIVVIIQYNLSPEDLEKMEEQLKQMIIFIGG